MTHNPEGPGAYLGHAAGDSEGQQRYRAVSRDLTMTSANAREQQRPCSHAVYGMQGLRRRGCQPAVTGLSGASRCLGSFAMRTNGASYLCRSLARTWTVEWWGCGVAEFRFMTWNVQNLFPAGTKD